MDEKELLDNLDGMNIPQNAKEKVRKMLKKKQEKREQGSDRKELAKMIAMELKEILPDGKKLLDAIKKIEVKAPEINIPEIKVPEVKIPDFKLPVVNIPKIEVPNIPNINIPEIKIPKIEVPEIKIPKQEIIMPKEMEVKGIGSYFKSVNDSIKSIIKNKFSVILHGGIHNTGSVERDNPVPVIFVDEKGDYKRLGGGGVSIVPGVSTKDNQDTLIEHFKSVTNLEDSTLRTEGYYPMIAQKKIAGRSSWSKAGKILNPSATGFEIISNIAVIHPGGIQCEVVSASVDDTLAGTGIQKILLEFYDSNWVYQTEIIEMNGTTPVNTVSTDINRMECMSAYQVGSGNVSAGNITLKDTGVVNTYFQIDAKENFCPRCLHYVVPGSKSFITDILISSNTKEGVEFRLVTTVDHGAGAGTGGKVLIGRYAAKVVDTDVPVPFNIPIEMDASNSTVGMGLFLAVKGVAANQEAFGSMVGYDEVC